MLKNHVSILFWSLGNESYAGDNIEAMNRYLKEKPDGRIIHYEGIFHNRINVIGQKETHILMHFFHPDASALFGAPFVTVFLLCEYMHDMGNSLGGMDSYMKLLEPRTPNVTSPQIICSKPLLAGGWQQTCL